MEVNHVPEIRRAISSLQNSPAFLGLTAMYAIMCYFLMVALAIIAASPLAATHCRRCAEFIRHNRRGVLASDRTLW
jgi:hypothetical protein